MHNEWWSRAAAALALALAVGCSVEHVDDGGAPEQTVSRYGETAIQTANCDGRIQIAESNDTVCPSITNWSATNLFRGGTTFLAGSPDKPEGQMGRYCRYTWTGGGLPDGLDIGMLEKHAKLSNVGPDCRALVGQADVGLNAALASPLQEIYRDRVGWVSPEELLDGDTPTEGLRTPVTVAVLDTTPENNAMHRDPHGDLMKRLVEDVACPAGPGPGCAVTVKRILALPRTGDGWLKDTTHGGVTGAYHDLAVALFDTVERWRLGPNPGKLIINFSIGWDPELLGHAPDAATANIAHIRNAIKYATCRGALVVAAAGNDQGLCRDDHPLSPAWWETLATLDPVAECPALLDGDLGVPVVASSYAPLVHAVGGLDRDDAPLPQARDGAMPRLAAFADHAAGGSPIGQARAGTSVSAAVASGTAALLWSYADDLSREQVMQAIYDGGRVLGSEADFGLSASDVHGIDVCGALVEACDVSSAGCGFDPVCTGRTGTPGVPEIDAALAANGTTYAYSPPLVPLAGCTSYCGEIIDARGNDPVLTCDDAHPDPSDAFVNPQPPDPPCPNCTLKIATNTAELTLDPLFAGLPFASVSISVTDAATGELLTFSFRNVMLTTTRATELTIPVSGRTLGDATVEIEFTDPSVGRRGNALLKL